MNFMQIYAIAYIVFIVGDFIFVARKQPLNQIAGAVGSIVLVVPFLLHVWNIL